LVRPWQIVDLTPGYRELAPPPELRDVVACLWIRVHGAGDDVRVVPDACSDVVWEQGAGTTVVGPDTRRFSGDCAIEIPGGAGADEPAISGTLGYLLDVRALAPSDPPVQERADWLERHDASFASIGAMVLEPVPVAADRAARLYVA